MILAYHEFCEKPVRDVYSLTPETFRRHALLVGECGGLSESITFDDAHASQFCIAAPILDGLGISGVFFATTAWVGCCSDIMSWRELRELHKAGHTIGSHTHTHPMLTASGDRSLRNELTVSKQLLEDLIGDDVTCISMPSGRVNARVLVACKAAGYSRVYTSRVGEYKAASEDLPEVVGRLVVRKSTSERTLRDYMEGKPGTCRVLRMESATKELAKLVVGNSLYQRVWRYAVRSKLYSN